MLYGLSRAAPDVTFIPANPEATCAFMKMITLPKLCDSLRDARYEVRVPEEIARQALDPDRTHGGDRLIPQASARTPRLS